MLRIHRTGVRAVMVGLLVAGCATGGGAPIRTMPETTSGELSARMRTGSAVGGVIPMAVGMSNGTDQQFRVPAERVVAIDAAGNRIAALSLAEATALAGEGLASAEARYLGEAVSAPGQPLTGIVFFPDGDYYSVRLIAIPSAGGDEREVMGFKAM